MERRYKDGVDYWNIDVDFFENKKVRLIRGEFGVKGIYIYLLILNDIYRTCGYYKKWDSDDCLLMSDSLGVGGDCSPQLIAEVVQGLVRRSLFDKGVFDRFGVLTSAEIQRRFLRIVGNSRDSIPIIQEYFLLNPSSRKDVTGATLSKCAFFSISSKENAQNLKAEGENFKVLNKEQNRKEQNRTEEKSGGSKEGADLPVAESDTATDEPPPPCESVLYFKRRLNPNPSEILVEELEAYEKKLGPKVCIRAMQHAMDENSTGWNFVKSVFERCLSQGIYTIEAWDEAEEKHKGKRARTARKRSGGMSFAELAAQMDEEEGVTG